MFGYIYKTTNTINNKIYVGQHKTDKDCLDESYIGSGKLLLEAIAKYGREKFICEIIEWCETEEELNDREIYYIKELKSTTDFGNYNISDGGFVPRFSGVRNGMYGVHRPKTEAEKQHLSEVLKGRAVKGHPWTEKQRETYVSTFVEYNKTRDYSEVSKALTGSKMMTDGNVQKWIKPDDIQKMLDEGWVIGSCKKRAKKNYKSGSNPLIGRNRKPTTSNRKWMNNGVENKMVREDEISTYLNNGWKFGMFKTGTASNKN